MQIEYDRLKDAINRAKHGMSLADAARFEWRSAQIEEDLRFDYGEQRFKATGYIDARLYRLIYCIRGNTRRVISLRRANKREYRDYAST